MSTDLSLFPAEPATPPSAQDSGERTSLYRAYRSRTFAEVAGQQHVTQTLRNAVIHGKVAHAYLFTGPRGTGKTSTARILARAVNCLAPRDGEPCNECAICVSMIERRSIDLIEIDGASNNSVDDVRELRDRVQFRPAEARRKVFIIDEVHMLSIGAFNALLKTLEEPPDHVLFLLATTEIHKVPLTVLSRCQRHDLRAVPLAEMVERLRYICGQEELDAEDAVLELLAGLSTGSLRDAESLLEQVRAYCGDSLRLAEVESALGVARLGEIAALADLMAAGDLAGALLLLGTMMDGGIEPRQLTRQLSGYWRDAILARARRQKVAEPHVARVVTERIIPVLRSLLSVESVARRSDSPRFALELAVAEATLQLAPGASVSGRPEPRLGSDAPTDEAPISAAPAAAPTMPETPTRAARMPAPASAATEQGGHVKPPPASPPPRLADQSTPAADSVEMPPASDIIGTAAEPAPNPASVNGHDGAVPERAAGHGEGDPGADPWPEVLRRLQESGTPSVQRLVQKAVRGAITAEQEVLTLGFLPSDKFVLHMLETPANRQALEHAVHEIYGGRWIVRCVTISEPPAGGEAEDQARDYLEDIAAEFSGGRFGP
ncbi:MAG: DNA polymerase III subunit gamma/tau, partial [Chloroflexota bacterium]